MVAAGAVPASHVPEESLGRADLTEVAGAELVEALLGQLRGERAGALSQGL